MEWVKDRVALITGATNEIGRAISLRLVRCGAKVVVSDNDQSGLKGLITEIKDNGGEVLGVVADPTKAVDVKKTVDEVLSKFGKVDILVNNVGDSKGQRLADLTDDEWNQTFDENINGVFHF